MLKKYLLYHKSKTLKKKRKEKKRQKRSLFLRPIQSHGFTPQANVHLSLPPSAQSPGKILNCQSISKQYMF